MQQLNVFSNNNFTKEFWGMKSGLEGCVNRQPIDLGKILKTIAENDHFILIDFYFDDLTDYKKKVMIYAIKHKIIDAGYDKRVLILSELFTAGHTVLANTSQLNGVNLSGKFLDELSEISKQIKINNHTKCGKCA